MNVLAVVAFLCSLLAIATAQFGFRGYTFFNSFDGPSASALHSDRDPRQNPGPVVFPPAPPDNGETSGVIVGASGFGFVPPNNGANCKNGC